MKMCDVFVPVFKIVKHLQILTSQIKSSELFEVSLGNTGWWGQSENHSVFPPCWLVLTFPEFLSSPTVYSQKIVSHSTLYLILIVNS